MVVDGTVEGPGVTKLQRAFTFYYIDKRRSSTEVSSLGAGCCVMRSTQSQSVRLPFTCKRHGQD